MSFGLFLAIGPSCQAQPAPESFALQTDLGPLVRKVQALRDAGQNAQVIELVENNWLNLVTAESGQANFIGAPRSSILWNYFEALQGQIQAQEAPRQAAAREHYLTSLQTALNEIPAVLDDRGDWIYAKLVDQLLEEKRVDEALQWAKRRYVLSAFDAGTLDRCARMVERVLALKDPTYALHQNWVEAQRKPDSSVPNPLAAIPFPGRDAPRTAALLELLQNRALQAHALISVLLVEGRNREAMEVALDLLVQKKDTFNGPREVCRVLKATDGRLQRANAFASFLKTVDEENPLPAFFAEAQTEAAKRVTRPGENPAPLTRARFSGEEMVSLAGRGTPVPALVSESAVVAPFMTLFTAVRNGTASPEELWKRGVINADDIATALSSWFPQKQRLALVALLAKNAPEQLKLAPDAPANVRLALADYFRSIGDARAEPLFLGILSEIKEPQKEGVLALSLLAASYEESGHFEKAAKTYEQAEQYSTNRLWIGDLLVHAARAFKKAGDAQKSQEIYDKVPGYGYGWATVMSYYDQALPLINAGKLIEAQAIISRPAYPEGVVVASDPNSVNAFLAQNAWLAQFAYQQGSLEEAMRYGQEVMKLGEATKMIFPEAKGLYALGSDIHLRAGGWKTQPIQIDVKEVIINSNPSQPDQPLYARFRIKTYDDTVVNVATNNPFLQIRVLPINNWGQKKSTIKEEESEVIVKVLPGAAQAFKNAVIEISTRNRGNRTLVPIELIAR